MTFLKNTWYVACTADTIDEKPLGRMICNERMGIYRGQEGKVAALEDFCPHRGAPLSLGTVVEGTLTCGYHGLELGCDGKTIAMPGQRVKAFPAIRATPCKTTQEGDTVITSRFMNEISAPPFWRMALRGNHLADNVPVDRWQICRFTPPSHVMIEVGVAHAGHGGYDAPDEHKVYSIVTDFITPETDTSIWYFWGMARKFNAGDKGLTASIREGQCKIFSEDLEMLEHQQLNHSAHPSRNLLKLNIDSGWVFSRRVLDRLIEQEKQGAKLAAKTQL